MTNKKKFFQKANTNPLTKREVFEILKGISYSTEDTPFLTPATLKKNIETINIKDSNKRILAENVISSINVPPFNNSAVDGYAVISDDIILNKKFKIIGKIVAGDDNNVILNKSEAVRIFTGARIPSNADTIIMQENASEKSGFVSFVKIPKKNENYRIAGEDINKGQLVLEKGTILKTQNQSLLTSIGLNKIKVYKKLRVGFYTIGDELVEPKTNLKGSEINNSNSLGLFSLIEQSGFNAEDFGRLFDHPHQIKDEFGTVNNLNNCDVIITTGGSSVGEEDHIISVLKNIGILIFWKIAIKPGRPLGFGFINDRPIICLPGNPVSVFLLFSMLIKPFLLRIAGAKWNEPKSIPAKINFSMKKKTERMEWLRVVIDKSVKNELVVSKYPRQGSGIISSIAFSDGIIEIPESKSELKPGDVFSFYPSDFLY